MKLRNLVVTVAILAAFALPAVAGGQEAPVALVTASPTVSSQAVAAPPTSADLLGSIFADGGGLPCPQLCFASKDCFCEPPVVVSCTGCSSCSVVPLGVKCDGVVTRCPACF